MNDYSKVSNALAAGTPPAMLCTTCPWDRFCISPPTMTAAEVKQQIDDATAKDRAAAEEQKAAGKDGGMPVQMLMTALAIGGRDTQAGVCPVFALRLRTGGGREAVDLIKGAMQGWDDER